MVCVLSILITILFSISASVVTQPGRAFYYISLQKEPKQPGDPFITMEVRFFNNRCKCACVKNLNVMFFILVHILLLHFLF